MEIKSRSRTELKSYFRKSSIPTESQFVELIDGMLNQKDDGLVKLHDSPLSLEATGDDTSVKPLINFYWSFRDPSPAWTLTLNPRSDPNHAGSARAGLNISDGDGKSRLFIDATTGNIGIGTTNPEAKLDVYATGQTHALWYEAIRFSQTANSAITLPSGGLLFGLRSDRNFYFADIKEGFKKYVMTINADTGNVGIGPTGQVARLEVAVDATDGDTMPLLIGKGPSHHLTILNNGNVGIGTIASAGKLEVAVAATETQTLPLVVKKGQEEYLKIRNDGPVDVLKDLYVVGTVEAGSLRGALHADDIHTGTLRPACLPQQEGWRDAELGGYWVRYDDKYNPPQFFKDNQGIVHLRGTIRERLRGSMSNPNPGNPKNNIEDSGPVREEGIPTVVVLLNLPEGYRPLYRQIHAVCTYDRSDAACAFGRIDVLPDGRVFMMFGNYGWISLDGISFRAA